MYNKILQRVKYFLNAKMINLEKIKQHKWQPSSPSQFKKTCLVPYFHLLFECFGLLPLPREVIKIHLPSL